MLQGLVICVVPGWAAGGGHSLHVVCDLTLASREHARFKQTDADVASFDGGFGSAYLARQVGQKFAREIFFLGETYDAEAAHRMGMVNAVVPHADLERTALDWAQKINGKSRTSQRMLKYAFNLIDDGLVGQQLFAAEATRLAYMADEAVEGRDAFLEKRDPDWARFPITTEPVTTEPVTTEPGREPWRGHHPGWGRHASLLHGSGMVGRPDGSGFMVTVPFGLGYLAPAGHGARPASHSTWVSRLPPGRSGGGLGRPRRCAGSSPGWPGRCHRGRRCPRSSSAARRRTA